MSIHPDIEAKIQADYAAVDEYVKEDIGAAYAWAKDRLMRHEGEGHAIYVTSHHSGDGVVCSFAKPQWPGDHCSRVMEHGAEAIVMAVCEYLNGA